MMLSSRELLNLAIEAAVCAGKELAATSTNGSSPIVQKLPRDLKLAADLRAEQVIRERLSVSGIPVLGEEDGWGGGHRTDDLFWIVDGLDGTVNFHYSIPLACISIALSRGQSPELGVVYDFNRDEIFSGIVGSGAFLNGSPVTISDVTAKSFALLLTAISTKMNNSPESLAAFGIRLSEWMKVRMLGSAALSMAYVAAGRADACDLASIMIWDVAAGTALIRAAGGQVIVTERMEEHVVDVFAHNGKVDFVGLRG